MNKKDTMSKKREPKVRQPLYGWGVIDQSGGLWAGHGGLDKQEVLSWNVDDGGAKPVTLATITRARYRELCAAEKERDALRTALNESLKLLAELHPMGERPSDSQKGGKP